MALIRKRYRFLRPGLINTFKVKAYAAGASSSWSDPISLLTSEYDQLRFGDGKALEASPRWWNRVIRVSWTPAFPPSFKWEDRLSHYRIFRFKTTAAFDSSPPESQTGYLNWLAGHIHNEGDGLTQIFGTSAYLADAGRSTVYIDDDVEEEQTYYYWVYGVDRKNVVSSNYCG